MPRALQMLARQMLGLPIVALLAAAPAMAAPPASPTPPASPIPPGSPTPEQRQAIEQIIHDYLLHNPQFLVEVLKAAEDKLQQEADEQSRHAVVERRAELLSDPSSPVGGNPEGDVTLVEFFDYRCPYCKQVEPALEALIREDPKLRIVYKEFPILGPESVYASRAALAARRQGKYDAFHTAMMAARGQITNETVLKVAGSVGLDLARLKSDMASPEIDAIIQHDNDLAQALDLRGTPAFIIGGDIAPGAADLATLRQMVAAARKAG